MFISKTDKFSSIKDFIAVKNISEDITIKTSETALQALLEEYPNNGLTQINEDVSYFKSRPDTDRQQHLYSNEGGGGDNPVTPGVPISSDPTYVDFSIILVLAIPITVYLALSLEIIMYALINMKENAG